MREEGIEASPLDSPNGLAHPTGVNSAKINFILHYRYVKIKIQTSNVMNYQKPYKG